MLLAKTRSGRDAYHFYDRHRAALSDAAHGMLDLATGWSEMEGDTYDANKAEGCLSAVGDDACHSEPGAGPQIAVHLSMTDASTGRAISDGVAYAIYYLFPGYYTGCDPIGPSGVVGS